MQSSFNANDRISVINKQESNVNSTLRFLMMIEGECNTFIWIARDQKLMQDIQQLQCNGWRDFHVECKTDVWYCFVGS